MSTYRNLINEIYIDGFTSADDVKTFRVPENFDRYNEGSGWQAYRGGNDWENGTTGVAVYLSPEGYNKEMARIWFEVKFPPHLEEYVSSNKGSSAPSSIAVRKWGDKAARRWMRETVNIRRATKQFHGAHDGYPREWVQRKTWKECFMLALESEKMKPFIKNWGVDHTKWIGMKRCNINEGLKLASQFWWVDPNGKYVSAKDAPNYAHKGSNISDLYRQGFIRLGYSGGGHRYLEMMYDKSRKLSAQQWRAIKDISHQMGADEVFDLPNRRNVWIRERRLNESGIPSKYWWMDKNGELIPVGPEQHAPVGRQMLGLPISAGVYQEMYDKGFLRVAFTGYWGSYQIEINYNPHTPPSLKQWRALKDLAIEMGAEGIRDNTGGKEVRVDESRLLFENFYENKEWFIYEGDNTITAVFEDNSRQTFKVHFRDNRLREDREKHRKRAASTWKRLAMEVRKSAGLSRSGNPIVIPWQECFTRALKDPLMMEYIDDLRAMPIFEAYGWFPMYNIWLDQDGKAYKGGSHEGIASTYLHSKGIHVSGGYRAVYEEMYKRGFARVVVGDNAYPLIVDTGNTGAPRLTRKQREWIEDKSFELGLDGMYSNAHGQEMRLEEVIYEMTYDELRQSMRNYKTKADLRKGTTTGSDDRERGARNVNVRSLRVVSTVGKDGDEHETSMFSYKSGNPSGDPRRAHQRWQGHIRFIEDSKGGVVAPAKGKQDVEVNCTCPDYKYVWAKANSDVDAGDTGKATPGGFSAGGPVSKVEPKSMQYKTQVAPGEKKPVNIFEATDDYGIQQGEPVDVDKRWRFQGGNTNNGTYGKRIRNPQNTPGLCKHLIALAEYIEKEVSPVAPEEPGKEEPSPVAPEKPSKLKKTGKPINIFESIRQFALAHPTFDVPYED